MTAAPLLPSRVLDETTPLLPSPTGNEQADKTVVRQKKPSPLFITTVAILWVLIIEFGDELINPAQTRVFESIYCQLYYKDHDPSVIGNEGHGGIAEKWCKIPVVQGQVAMLKGWQNTLNGIGMLLFSLPWGYFADVYGRRPTLFLVGLGFWLRSVYVQIICYFGLVVPLKLIWISSLHTLIGGSSSVAAAMIYTVISDVTPEEGRVTIFLRVQAASIATQVGAPILSATLMNWNPWVPMLSGVAIMAIPLLLVLYLPETLNYNAPETDSIITSSSSSTISTKSEHFVLKMVHTFSSSLSFLGSDIRILFILPAFFLHMLILNRDTLLQYISTRYAISIASATVLISVRSGLILFSLLLFLPALSYLLRHRLQLSSQKSDLILAQGSTIIMGLGFLMIALAPTIPLLMVAMALNSFGWGLTLFLRSLMTSLIEEHHIARLNTLVGVVDTIGFMTGSPFLAWAFGKGLELGGWRTGLPFLICAGALAIVTIFQARLGIREDRDFQQADEDLASGA
ncbi:MFS transporter [Venturia nashicola]|nr:MFS transporter [Venturia nashicola]